MPNPVEINDIDIHIRAVLGVSPGVAREIKELAVQYQGVSRIPLVDIQRVKGIGKVTVERFVHFKKLKEVDSYFTDFSISFDSPSTVYSLVYDRMSVLEQEELWVLALDTRNRLIKEIHLYKGTVNSSTVRVAEVIKSCIEVNATSMIMVHNHPSGDPKPSPEDMSLTRSVKEICKLVEIDFLDHIIVGRNTYVSLKEKGVI